MIAIALFLGWGYGATDPVRILVEMLAPGEIRDAIQADVRPIPLASDRAQIARRDGLASLNRSIAEFELLPKQARHRAIVDFVAWCEREYEVAKARYLGKDGAIHLPPGWVKYQISKLDLIAFVQGEKPVFDDDVSRILRRAPGRGFRLEAALPPGAPYVYGFPNHASPIDFEVPGQLALLGYFDRRWSNRRPPDVPLPLGALSSGLTGMSTGEQALINMPSPAAILHDANGSAIRTLNSTLHSLACLPLVDKRIAMLKYIDRCSAAHSSSAEAGADDHDITRLDLVAISLGLNAETRPEPRKTLSPRAGPYNTTDSPLAAVKSCVAGAACGRVRAGGEPSGEVGVLRPRGIELKSECSLIN